MANRKKAKYGVGQTVFTSSGKDTIAGLSYSNSLGQYVYSFHFNLFGGVGFFWDMTESEVNRYNKTEIQKGRKVLTPRYPR